MSSISFRVPLSAEEQAFYGQNFKRLDPESLGIVTGEAAKPLLAASGLSPQLLSQVWALSDTNNKGFLDLNEFSAALRMIGHLQKNPNLAVSRDLYDTPSSSLPFIQNTTASPPPAMGTQQIPPVTASDMSRFGQLFDRTANGAQLLSGDKAKEVFLKARLPNQTLGELWTVCDRNASGFLDKTEFIMAMHLIDLTLSNHPSLQPLPATLPASLWQSIHLPAQQSGAQQPSITSSRSPSIARQPTISRLSSGAFTNASSDWSLTPEKKAQFDAIFDTLDKSHAGSLGSQVLVPFFVSSKLSQETLATIWDLADIHNNAEFTKVEFAIAMFLIQKKNSGVELPDVIPDQLLRSPALGLYTQPQNMGIPSRDTKPNFQEVAPQQIPQNSNNGSLNDLMALNASFTSPPPVAAQQPVARNNTNNNFTSDTPASRNASGNQPPVHSSNQLPTGLKKFTPTSNFGQSIIREEDEQLNQPIPAVSPLPASTSSPTMSNAAQRSSSVPLKTVPNFASLSLPAPTAVQNKNGDLFADAEASTELSSATTDLANLSTQVNSLSTQASMTNDKKSRARKELNRVNEMKASIESKLATLRATHEQNVKETEQLEGLLAEGNKELETLKQQLAVSQESHDAIQTTINELNQTLQETQQQNAQLKEQISSLNARSSSLQTQLKEKQQQVKQQRSMVDVNNKQLELNQQTVTSLETEIQGLTQKLETYLAKRKELDDYQKTVETQHSQLQAKYQELENKNKDLAAREQELADRTKQVEEQEALYHQHVSRLQSMFDELSKRKASFEQAEEQLEKQHIEYAQKVQQLSERQMKLAMGEVPEDADEIIKQNKTHIPVTKQTTAKTTEDTSKFVDETVTHSKLGRDDEEGTESDVFDKDIPTVGSQTEGEPEEEPNSRVAEEQLTDRFEGDLNEYGLPRTESLTSSVANNAPQSVRGDTELPENEGEAPGDSTIGEVSGQVKRSSHIPGEWEASAANTAGTVTSGQLSESPSEKMNTISPNQPKHIDEEFPPIQELDISEGDSSSDEDNFHDTRDDFQSQVNHANTDIVKEQQKFQDTGSMPKQHVSTQNASTTPAPAPAVPVKDEFDDEFAGLEQAAEEDDTYQSETTSPQKDSAQEAFETIEHQDLDDELQQNAFTGSVDVSLPPNTVNQEHNQSNVGNDEWDEIFAGFGNAKVAAAANTPNSEQPTHTPIMTTTTTTTTEVVNSNAPVNRAFATTPKSLAIEELSGMGFSQEEATKALENCNWDLDAATNYLLDNA